MTIKVLIRALKFHGLVFMFIYDVNGEKSFWKLLTLHFSKTYKLSPIYFGFDFHQVDNMNLKTTPSMYDKQVTIDIRISDRLTRGLRVHNNLYPLTHICVFHENLSIKSHCLQSFVNWPKKEKIHVYIYIFFL